ncbi:NAD(P)H-hydrate dehydratase [Telmatospirillum sp. J64-1]|uniref:NAD(P)H-hydrate dehydratase n=1 Tax=Telmatospirillum sp. J64-1 TaxID=2502183 RepID=UPI00115CCBCB|nr:NAD(P)H-hydrate dehydratase [Telmatospirillum sp. J64-1]
MNQTALLTVAQMYAADRAAMARGISGVALMEAAGWSVAREVRRRWPRRSVVVLCGPGNNGGDGFVAARFLAGWGMPVRLALLGERAALQGDAAVHAARWRGRVEPLGPDVLSGNPVVVDCLFGAGLSRPVDGTARQVIEEIVRRRLAVLAVDMPSGVQGDTGQVLGVAAPAVATVTFFRRKPGHLLLPGRLLAGEVVVADIGIPSAVLEEIAPSYFVNDPDLWRQAMPRPDPSGHKYDRGHLLVVGGARMTGAARMAALAARRMGAGMLTLAAPREALAVYQADRPGNIVLPLEQWEELLGDRRRNAVLLGPGGGQGAEMRRLVLSALSAGKACVLDADAVTSFAGDHCAALTEACTARCVLTPHDGEFARLFPDLGGDRLSRAREAARRLGGIMVLKGADTVIAAPDGRAAINANAPPSLATAGTGDVLAGMVAGLLAQGVDPFLAACAAVWLHGAAATEKGPGLIAEDIPEFLPLVIARLGL